MGLPLTPQWASLWALKGRPFGHSMREREREREREKESDREQLGTTKTIAFFNVSLVSIEKALPEKAYVDRCWHTDGEEPEQKRRPAST